MPRANLLERRVRRAEKTLRRIRDHYEHAMDCLGYEEPEQCDCYLSLIEDYFAIFPEAVKESAEVQALRDEIARGQKRLARIREIAEGGS